MIGHGGERQPRSWLALLTVFILLAGCASATPTPSPPSTSAPARRTAAPTASPTPAATPVAVFVPTPVLLPTPTATASPTEEVTPVPTEEVTPEPTEAPSPTPTPLPTAIPLPTVTPRPTSGPNLAISAVARAPADPAAAKTAAASINAFGLDLFRQLLAGQNLSDRNTVFSPTSIALALVMALAGAKGETASQMDAVLHTSGWDAFGPSLNSLDQALVSRNETWTDYDGSTHALALNIANAAFAQQGWKIEQPYLDAIAAAFGSGLRLVDYKNAPETARQLINAWVNGQTAGRIPKLLGPDDLNAMTRLVLVNAIYLKAAWVDTFSPAEPASFTRLDGSKTDVQMMEAWGGQAFPYASGNGWQATELPYETQGASYEQDQLLEYDGGVDARHPLHHVDSSLVMTLILPDDVRTFEKALSPNQLDRITTALAAQRQRLWQLTFLNPAGCSATYPYAILLDLPRFGIDTKASLTDELKALGMPLPFTGGKADFSGIHVPASYEDILYIQKVIHEANISVDEQGAEAAAATAVIGGSTGGPGCLPAPEKTITLRFDHPFLYFVRDLDTGAVLFMGQVTDPSAKKGS